MSRSAHWYGIKLLFAHRRKGRLMCFEERVLLARASSERTLGRIIDREVARYCRRSKRRVDTWTVEPVTAAYEVYLIDDSEQGDNPLEVYSHLYRRKRSRGRFLAAQEIGSGTDSQRVRTRRTGTRLSRRFRSRPRRSRRRA